MTLIEDRFTDDGVDAASTQPLLHAPRCCAEAFAAVHAAFWSYSSGAGMDEAAVARGLRHEHVAHELVDELGCDDVAAFGAFAEAVAGAVRDADRHPATARSRKEGRPPRGAARPTAKRPWGAPGSPRRFGCVDAAAASTSGSRCP